MPIKMTSWIKNVIYVLEFYVENVTAGFLHKATILLTSSLTCAFMFTNWRINSCKGKSKFVNQA